MRRGKHHFHRAEIRARRKQKIVHGRALPPSVDFSANVFKCLERIAVLLLGCRSGAFVLQQLTPQVWKEEDRE